MIQCLGQLCHSYTVKYVNSAVDSWKPLVFFSRQAVNLVYRVSISQIDA